MSDPSSCQVVLNPDIAGVGIRVSLYILSLAGPISAVTASSPELFRSIERSLAVTGLALLLTSFISVGQGTFDLFHALCILHLIGLSGFSLRPAPRDGQSNRVVQFATYGIYFLGLMGFTIFMMYIFVKAPRFGPTPDCNQHVVYVLFGFNVPALNYEFRWLLIAYMIMGLLGFLMGTIAGFAIIITKSVSDTGNIRHLRFLGDLAGRAYIIAMLELIIRNNNALVDGSDWSFGQILAMMMLIGPAIELIALLTRDKPDEEEENLLENPITLDALHSVLKFVGFGILDLGFNAAAGAAAAATGAHVNGNPITEEVIRIGAWAAVIKSGILNYSFLVFIMSTSATSMVVSFASTTFGIAFVVTLAVAQRVLHSVPDALLIGALAAGAPLTVGGAIVTGNFAFQYSLPFNAAYDALSGYTFARVAHNHGFDVCSYKAAAAAGAVFGVLIWAFKLPIKWVREAKKEEKREKMKQMLLRRRGH